MSRLGRLYNTLQKPTGDAALGVSVEVRRQGATITSNQSSSSSPHPFAVDDPGGIAVADSVHIGTGTTAYTVTAIGASTVSLAFSGTLTVTAGDRLTPTNNLPSLSADRRGNTSKTNPLLTSTPFGEYSAYLDGGEYDLLASGGGYGTKLFIDVSVSSPRMVINEPDSASAKGFIFALRAALATSGAKVATFENADGNPVFTIDKNGNIAGAAITGDSLTVDNLVVANTIDIPNSSVTPAMLQSPITLKKLASDVSNSTTTPAKITGLDQTLQPGVYAFQYFIRYQAAATTTGVRFSVNFSGTVTSFVANTRYVDNSALAATAAADQDAVGAAAQVLGGMSARTKSDAGWGTTISVDTQDADMLMIVEGLMTVTVAGDIQLYHGSEVAAASTVKAGTLLILHGPSA